MKPWQPSFYSAPRNKRDRHDDKGKGANSIPYFDMLSMTTGTDKPDNSILKNLNKNILKLVLTTDELFYFGEYLPQ